MEIKDELLDIEGIKNSKKSLLDLFIRRTAVLTQTSESVVDLLIKDQWRNATKESQAGKSTSEFDFCNLGTFYLSENKAKRRLESLDRRIKAVQELPEDPETKVMQRRLLGIQRYEEQKTNIKIKTKQI